MTYGQSRRNKRELERCPASLLLPRPEKREKYHPRQPAGLPVHAKTNKMMRGQYKERPGVAGLKEEDVKDRNRWLHLVHSRPTRGGA